MNENPIEEARPNPFNYHNNPVAKKMFAVFPESNIKKNRYHHQVDDHHQANHTMETMSASTKFLRRNDDDGDDDDDGDGNDTQEISGCSATSSSASSFSSSSYWRIRHLDSSCGDCSTPAPLFPMHLNSIENNDHHHHRHRHHDSHHRSSDGLEHRCRPGTGDETGPEGKPWVHSIGGEQFNREQFDSLVKQWQSTLNDVIAYPLLFTAKAKAGSGGSGAARTSETDEKEDVCFNDSEAVGGEGPDESRVARSADPTLLNIKQELVQSIEDDISLLHDLWQIKHNLSQLKNRWRSTPLPSRTRPIVDVQALPTTSNGGAKAYSTSTSYSISDYVRPAPLPSTAPGSPSLSVNSRHHQYSVDRLAALSYDYTIYNNDNDTNNSQANSPLSSCGQMFPIEDSDFSLSEALSIAKSQKISCSSAFSAVSAATSMLNCIDDDGEDGEPSSTRKQLLVEKTGSCQSCPTPDKQAVVSHDSAAHAVTSGRAKICRNPRIWRKMGGQGLAHYRVDLATSELGLPSPIVDQCYQQQNGNVFASSPRKACSAVESKRNFRRNEPQKRSFDSGFHEPLSEDSLSALTCVDHHKLVVSSPKTSKKCQ